MDVRARYAQGDYRKVAERLRPAAAALVEAAGIADGDRVLDVAAGTGNVALECVRRGADVVAVDVSPEQVALGRTAPELAAVAWVVGDAARLPVGDGAAAAVLSTFGAMYVPDPDRAVAEMTRVCRPGGTVATTSWVEGGYQSEAGRLLQRHLPSTEDYDSYQAWGREAVVRERVSRYLQEVEVARRTLEVSYPSLDDYWSSVLESAPPVVDLRRRVSETAFAGFMSELREITRRHSTSAGAFVLRDEYLMVLGRRPRQT